MKIPGMMLAVGLPAVLVCAAAGALLQPHPHPPAAPRPAVAAARACAHQLPVPFTGIALPKDTARAVAGFAQAAGMHPQVLEYYTVFGDRFSAGRADAAAVSGAVPLMQWNPRGGQLTAIAAGAEDGYLRAYAAAVRGFGCPLMLSFAHEFNGPWWPWGNGRQTAAAYVAAWRHIHAVFTKAGALNVIWVWNPNIVSGPRIGDPARWWPGPADVTMVALDGYYWGPGETFASVFRKTIREVRRFTSRPVFLAETGAYPGKRMARRISGLFRGAASSGLAGVVYFDIRGARDWQLEDNRPALAAFGAAAKSYSHPGPGE